MSNRALLAWSTNQNMETIGVIVGFLSSNLLRQGTSYEVRVGSDRIVLEADCTQSHLDALLDSLLGEK